MARTRLDFAGHDGSRLSALLEVPDGPVKGYALFAHCFSCGKDVPAASRISRAMVERGFGVLRFDFTGLGNSDGDFANTGFTSNVSDLLRAVDFMRETYEAPVLLMGHSLGGTAVLAAAGDVPECRGVVSIGAPSSPAHVIHQFEDHVEEIERAGSAEVLLGGRPFRIGSAFVSDVSEARITEQLRSMRKSLLVFHAPLDDIVSVNEAEIIYRAALHPKSFVSLDGADHLLTRKADAGYVASVTSSWIERYLDSEDTALPEVPAGEVRIDEYNQKFARTVQADQHQWLADEPKSVGGSELGPDPYEHLLAALGACTSMTIRMYANRKALPLDRVVVNLRHAREHSTDCEGCDETPARIERLHREIAFEGDLTDAQQARLMEIADRCPVHRTLAGELVISSEQVALS